MFAFEGARFQFYSISHIVPLIIIAAAAAALYFFRRFLQQSAVSKRIIGIIIPFLVLTAFALQFIWIVSRGYFNIRYSLPLHLCDITFMLVFFLCLFPNKYLAEIMYFIGIGGALQALLTPALAYDFPHINYLFFFAEHGLVIVSALYFVFVKKYHITLKSLFRAFLFFNVTGVIVLGVNLILGSNYMFIMKKPAFPSLFDLLGPWPVYLVIAEMIAAAVFGLLYLLFFIAQRKNGN